MAYYTAKGALGAAVSTDGKQQLLIPIPQDGATFALVYRLAGTFVGTVQAQHDQSGSFAAADTVPLGATGTVSAGHPTAVGNFHAPVTAGAKFARLVFSAYTSGKAQVEAVLIPVSA